MSNAPPIEQANSAVRITEALAWIGEEVPDISGKSVKIYCPFGFQHADFGASPAFRVYPDTNSAWCFAGCGYFDPVRLLSAAWDRPAADVAWEILDRQRVVLAGPEDWRRILEVPEPAVDVAALAAALQEHCARICPQWRVVQFEEQPARTLSACLALLRRVTSQQEAWMWLETSEKIMAAAVEPLREKESSNER